MSDLSPLWLHSLSEEEAVRLARDDLFLPTWRQGQDHYTLTLENGGLKAAAHPAYERTIADILRQAAYNCRPVGEDDLLLILSRADFDAYIKPQMAEYRRTAFPGDGNIMPFTPAASATPDREEPPGALSTRFAALRARQLLLNAAWECQDPNRYQVSLGHMSEDMVDGIKQYIKQEAPYTHIEIMGKEGALTMQITGIDGEKLFAQAQRTGPRR